MFAGGMQQANVGHSVLGQMKSAGANSAREGKVARNEQGKAPFARHGGNPRRAFGARTFRQAVMTKDDPAAGWQALRRGDGIGNAAFVGDEQRRRDANRAWKIEPPDLVC